MTDTIISFAAGLIGAWVGAAIAFRKFKQERTFDRRLEWLLEALRADDAKAAAAEGEIGEAWHRTEDTYNGALPERQHAATDHMQRMFG